MPVNIVEKVDRLVKIERVLASVSDKSDLEKLVPGLVRINKGIQIYSTGGTYERIAEILGPQQTRDHLIKVSDYTGQPETQGGLVKTLDFKIYLGLLTEKYNKFHTQDLERTGALPIDMVVCNLYPFEQTVAEQGVTVEKARANIDIGGPSMVRAAAKNYLRVASVVDPADYIRLLEEMQSNDGCISMATRFRLAKKAFGHTASYDSAISAFLAGKGDKDLVSCYTFTDGWHG
ncbi:MAG: hypothetical protein GXP49_14325 [Deltaproteobacteria bacterium]|nr:hypothetical protein [Deltaproteobacteria bacterium]